VDTRGSLSPFEGYVAMIPLVSLARRCRDRGFVLAGDISKPGNSYAYADIIGQGGSVRNENEWCGLD
jgi:hypothetical protein